MGHKLQGSVVVDPDQGLNDYLEPSQIDRLLDAAKDSPNGIRDYTLVLLTYRHALRPCEAVRLQRDQINLSEARIFVRRAKGSIDSQQPLMADELNSIKRYLAFRDDNLPWLFISERRQQLGRRAINCITAEAGNRAGLGSVRPCMLRYSCGHALANKGWDYRVIKDWLGDRDPMHPTSVAAQCLYGLWD